MSILAGILRFIVTIVITIVATVAPGKTADATAPNAPLADNCKLRIATISDMHMKGGIEGLPNDLVLQLAIKDLEAADEKYDALVFTGDITNEGAVKEWQHLEKQLKGHSVADNIYLAVGNHDTWTRDSSDTRTFKGLFMEYNKKITGKFVGNYYYSTTINGYPFIFLSGEDDGTDMFLSNKQIKWFKNEMKKAAKLDKPIFVVSHWAFNKTHGLPVSWGDEEYDDFTGGIGEQSDKIKSIMKKYDNVFMISGHIHTGISNADTKAELGYESVEKVDNIWSLNLPMINGFNEVGEWFPGTSYTVEVYEDKVVFRARNFMTGLWRPEYNYTAELVR